MKVTKIVFLKTKEARLVVEMPASGPYLTSEAPWIPRHVFKLFPNIGSQRCYNDASNPFHREALATEIPHLFEHLIIEIQNQVRRGVGAPLRGETEWNWKIDPHGLFHVTVNYDNEVIALAAIRLAERIINAIDSREISHIDMPREMARLRELSKLTRRDHASRAPAAVPKAAGRGANATQSRVDAPLLSAEAI